MMHALLDGLRLVRSVLVTIPLVYLSTMVMGTLSLLVSVVDSQGRAQHACARWWARSLLFFARARVTVRGKEHLTPGQTYVFAANHQSYMDIPLLFGYLPANFRIMAKASLFPIPFLGWHLRRSGHMPIPQGNPRRAARSLLEAATHVREGTPVFIFPEGGRAPGGQMDEFLPGAFLLAIKAGVPVVPITLNGTGHVLPMNSWMLRPGRVEMVLHPPIPTVGIHAHDAHGLAKRVRDTVAAAFTGDEN